MLGVIYNYIVNPTSTIRRDCAPVIPALIAVSLAAVATASQPSFGLLADASPFFLVIFYTVLALGLWVVQTAFIELFAQFLGYSSPRLVLFGWLGMAHLPILVTLPLLGAIRLFPTLSWPLGILIGLCQLGSFVLQLITIQTVYEVSWFRSLLLYLLPVLSVVGSVIFLLIMLGVSAW